MHMGGDRRDGNARCWPAGEYRFVGRAAPAVHGMGHAGVVRVLALLKAFLAVFVFGTIRDDQLHEENGVPGGLWLLFIVLVGSAVLDIILGVFIFRGGRWARADP